MALDFTAPLLEPAEKRESVSDLIAKKREIFLVQIGLDIKLDEIAKLRDRAMQRDQALGKAEKLLDHDIKRFDDFLKEDAAKLQEALIHADTQTKAKQEKVRATSFLPLSKFQPKQDSIYCDADSFRFYALSHAIQPENEMCAHLCRLQR